MAAGREVQPVALAALARHRRPHVAHAEGVGDRRAPRVLDLAPDRAQAGARLAGRHELAEPQGPRIDAGLARPRGEVRGEAERAEDRVDAEGGDELEQPARLADADRHDGRARRLSLEGVDRGSAEGEGVPPPGSAMPPA